MADRMSGRPDIRRIPTIPTGTGTSTHPRRILEKLNRLESSRNFFTNGFIMRRLCFLYTVQHTFAIGKLALTKLTSEEVENI